MKKIKVLSTALLLSVLSLVSCNGDNLIQSSSQNPSSGASTSEATSETITSSEATSEKASDEGSEQASEQVTSSESTSVQEETSEEQKTIAITTATDEVFLGKTLQMEYESNPVDADVVWTVDSDKATISDDGLLEAVTPGKVNVTVTLKDDEEVSDSKEITIKDTLLDLSVNASSWDFTGVYSDDNVSFKSVDDLGNDLNSYANIKNVKSEHYAFSATVSLTNPKGDDTWSRVSLGHLDDDNVFHGMFVSPGPNFTARKQVVMDITNGGVGWGVVTDRSQVWNLHDLDSLDMSNMVLTTIRDGSNYYYLVNGELYWFEIMDKGATTPSFMAAQLQASFSNVKVELDQTKISEMISSVENQKFYPGHKEHVEIADDGTITFKNASAGAPLNAKDQSAKSIGQRALLPANKETTITFDYTITGYGATDGMPGLAVTMNRYDESPAEARSVLLCEFKSGFTGWNSNGDLNSGIGSGGVSYAEEAPLLENTLYHVTVTRLMTAEGQDMAYKVTDAEGKVLVQEEHGWKDGYSGNAVLSFLVRDLNCVLSNIVLTVSE